MMPHKAVFLDRDGVLNQAMVRQGKPYSPATLAELVIGEEVLPALTRLKSLGYLLIGATNQPDVARGKTEREVVEAMHRHLLLQLPLDDIRVCYHDDQDACLCRKPLPGLLQQAANDYHIDLKKSIMIGDRWKDIEAGRRAGCMTIWIQQGYHEPVPNIPPDYTTHSLQAASEWIAQL